jgi:hypothetical protein
MENRQTTKIYQKIEIENLLETENRTKAEIETDH